MTKNLLISIEILEYELKKDDQFMIVASDGVWEFLDNDQVLEIIKKHRITGDIESACDEIMRESLKRWQIEEEDTIDDITFVLVFFGQQH